MVFARPSRVRHLPSGNEREANRIAPCPNSLGATLVLVSLGSLSGCGSSDTNAPSGHINARAEECVERGTPVISVDTKEESVPSAGLDIGERKSVLVLERVCATIPLRASNVVARRIPRGEHDWRSRVSYLPVLDGDDPSDNSAARKVLQPMVNVTPRRSVLTAGELHPRGSCVRRLQRNDGGNESCPRWRRGGGQRG